MKTSSILITISILVNFSCSSNDSIVNIESFWVDAQRVSCIGLVEQTCYMVQDSATIDENNWQLFYDGILGFDEIYEEGYRYRLSVNKIEIKDPPQDSSSLRYELIEILNKELHE
ncbi:DUF4377 domain-containing protein [Hyunsoonleella flava]|uniref:DUF4377 domain-containing protein n=1 Tax=Hyunsoonleella flava TaxID=2527939 RepID=A0A4Q9FDM1_9FLAO|nr:DUF4377 domain-containing protein [Hyunsoonleella flava]TBN04272.1 DUF4377 domain-containing protein [Hyunsoonleella flava]